jgi:hypothetical protein
LHRIALPVVSEWYQKVTGATPRLEESRLEI